MRARNKEHGLWIRLDRQIAVMGLADLERKSAQREKQGEGSLVWNGNVRLRNRRMDERNGDGKAGAVLVKEDPGALE
jgi:hypothetical protein